MSAWDEIFEGEAGLPAALRQRVDDLAQLLGQLEAQLEALDESYVRHQSRNEEAFERARADTEAVRRELDNHLGDHWRERR